MPTQYNIDLNPTVFTTLLDWIKFNIFSIQKKSLHLKCSFSSATRILTSPVVEKAALKLTALSYPEYRILDFRLVVDELVSNAMRFGCLKDTDRILLRISINPYYTTIKVRQKLEYDFSELLGKYRTGTLGLTDLSQKQGVHLIHALTKSEVYSKGKNTIFCHLAKSVVKFERIRSSIDSAAIFKATGKLNFEVVNDFKSNLELLLKEEYNYLIVDLSNVPFACSSSFGEIAKISKALQEKNGKLFVLVGQNQYLSSFFYDLQYEKAFPKSIFENIERIYDVIGKH